MVRRADEQWLKVEGGGLKVKCQEEHEKRGGEGIDGCAPLYHIIENDKNIKKWHAMCM